MATLPRRIGYNTPALGYGDSSTPKTTLPFDVVAGDVITLIASSEDSPATLGTPSATGGSITWTLKQSIEVSGYCTMYAWQGDVGATASQITISLSRTAGSQSFSFGATQWREHGGIGATGKDNVASGAPSLALTCSANSALVTGSDDWTASDGTSRTWRTVNGAAMDETLYFRNSLTYTVYAGFRLDTGAAGSETVGLTAPSAQKYSIVGMEVLGATTGTGASVDSSSFDSGAFDTGAGGGPTTFDAAGTVAASSAVTGAVSAILLAAGAVAAVSGTSGDATRVPIVYQAAGSVAGISTTSGAVTSRLPASGSTAAITVASGSVTALLPTSGTVAAVTTTSGSPSLVGGAATLQAAGTVAALSTTSGTVTALRPATGTTAAVSTTSGSPTGLLHPSGMVVATSTTAGTVTLRAVASGVTASASSTSGVVVLRAQVSGTVAAVSTTSGDAFNPAVPVAFAQILSHRLDRDTLTARLSGITITAPLSADTVEAALGKPDVTAPLTADTITGGLS